MRISDRTSSTVTRLSATAAAIAAGALAFTGTLAGQVSQQAPPVFRTGTQIVRVDVIVRDKDGNVVKGLKQDDFLVAEDGKSQTVTSFSYEEIKADALPPISATTPVINLTQQILQGQRVAVAPKAPGAPGAAGAAKPAGEAAPPSAEAAPKPAAPANVRPEDLPGRRLVVMLFDTSSMQPDEIDRAVKSAGEFVDKQMTSADVVAIASIGQTLQMVREFTADRDQIKNSLAAFDTTAGTGFEQPGTPDTTDVTEDTDPADIPLDDSEFGIFNNDRRLKAMKVLCDAMAPVEQKKALMYFSAGMSRSGSDNEVELRAATNSCNKANTSIYTIDSRGLQAVVPGGDATRRSSGGQSAFSGRGMLSQFSSLQSSQETLSTLAADTGGQAFLDTNDFAPAFTKVQSDMSAYYLLGYSSTNPATDGKFRRIAVKLKNASLGYRLEARVGYYANTDFAHLAKEDRQHQLEDEISSAVSSTDLPVVATTSWFRVGNNQYYVPVSIAVPGAYVHAPSPTAKDNKNATIDLLGVMTDEQGRVVGKIQDAMQIPASQTADLSGKELQYQSGVMLPAGHFKVKVAVRENTDGTLGTFEFPITIPDLKTDTVKVSPIVLSTQLRFARGGGPGRGGPGGGGPGGFGGRGGGGFQSQRGGGNPAFGNQSQNPLLRGGQEIVQSLSHLVVQGQQMYFYYEVYDPTIDPATSAPKVQSSLAFYRGRVKVFESALVERTSIDAADRKASIFQLQLPSAQLKPGLYTCQVNVVDEVSGKFAFPRIALYVKEPPKTGGGQ